MHNLALQSITNKYKYLVNNVPQSWHLLLCCMHRLFNYMLNVSMTKKKAFICCVPLLHNVQQVARLRYLVPLISAYIFLKSHSFKVLSPPCANSLLCASTKSEVSKNISLALSQPVVQDVLSKDLYPFSIRVKCRQIFLVYTCETSPHVHALTNAFRKTSPKIFYLIYETVCSQAGVAKRLF